MSSILFSRPQHLFFLLRYYKQQKHALYGPVIRSIPAVPVVLTPALNVCPPCSPRSFQYLGSVPQPRAVGRADDNTLWGASPGGCVLLAACAYPPIPWLATNQVMVELLLQPFLQSRVASLGLSAQPKYLQMCLRCLLDPYLCPVCLKLNTEFKSSGERRRGQFHTLLLS